MIKSEKSEKERKKKDLTMANNSAQNKMYSESTYRVGGKVRFGYIQFEANRE